MNKFEETLQEIKKELLKEKKILIVYLYGSVARGDFSERHSDMDLFIIINQKKPAESIKEKINNHFIPIGIKHGVKLHIEYQGTDIKKEDQTLIKKMIEEGRIIYSAGSFTFGCEKLGMKQYLIYSYSLKEASNKTMFSKALHGRKSWYYKGKEKIVKEYEGISNRETIIPLGKGHLMIAKEKQKDIESLFKRFNINYKIERIVYS